MLSWEGVKPNPKKIESIKECQSFLLAKEVRSFLGLVNFYKKFIKDFSALAKLLIDLLKKEGLFEVHDAPMVGHHGEKITREFLGKTFYWPEMKEDLEHYVRTYVKCQSTKSVHKKSLGCLSPSQFHQVHLKVF